MQIILDRKRLWLLFATAFNSVMKEITI